MEGGSLPTAEAGQRGDPFARRGDPSAPWHSPDLNTVEVCIHRGASEVGGTLVELEAEGERLVLDAGLPLRSVPFRELLPDVPGLWADGDGSLRGLLISHGHPDHYGLADLAAPSVPVLIGERAAAILRAAVFFAPSTRPFPVACHLRHRESLRLGPFTVTLWLVDHSAFDADALLVEAGGRRLLYSGDLRRHGRKPGTIDALVAGVGRVDALLLEGTRVGRDHDSSGAVSEQDVEKACARAFRETAGMALAFYSAQNVDRLVTLYRAARRGGRTFVMDLYTASVAAATGRSWRRPAVWPRPAVCGRSGRATSTGAAGQTCEKHSQVARSRSLSRTHRDTHRSRTFEPSPTVCTRVASSLSTRRGRAATRACFLVARSGKMANGGTSEPHAGLWVLTR
jgi:glyoxylase-like metal-dependent hydrolase (beta-lactamase superfamily II)